MKTSRDWPTNRRRVAYHAVDRQSGLPHEGGVMANQKPCSNPNNPHGRGWNRPNMMRIHVRKMIPDNPDRPYSSLKTRKWVAVGWLCEKCQWVEFDQPDEAA